MLIITYRGVIIGKKKSFCQSLFLLDHNIFCPRRYICQSAPWHISHVHSPLTSLLLSLLYLLEVAFNADNLRVKYGPNWNESPPPRPQVVSSHLDEPCFSMLGRFSTAGLTKSHIVCILRSRRFTLLKQSSSFQGIHCVAFPEAWVSD